MEATAQEKKVVFIGNTKMYYNIQREECPANALSFIVANVSYNGLIPQPFSESLSEDVEFTSDEKRGIENAEKVFVIALGKPQFVKIVSVLVAQGFDIKSEKFVMVTNFSSSYLKSQDKIGQTPIRDMLKGRFIGARPEDVEEILLRLYPRNDPTELKKKLADHLSGKKVKAAAAVKRSSGEKSPPLTAIAIHHEKVEQCKKSFEQFVTNAHAEYEKIAELNETLKGRRAAGESDIPKLKETEVYQQSEKRLKELALEIHDSADLVATEAKEYVVKMPTAHYRPDNEPKVNATVADTFEKAVTYLFGGASLFYNEIKETVENSALSVDGKILKIKAAKNNIDKLAASIESKVGKLKILSPQVIAKIEDEDDREKAKKALPEKVTDWDKKLTAVRTFKIKSKIALANAIASLSVRDITPELVREAKEHVAVARKEMAEFEQLFIRINDEENRAVHQEMIARAAEAMINVLHLESQVINADKVAYDRELTIEKERYAGLQQEVHRGAREKVVADDIVPQLAILKERANTINTKAAACEAETKKEFEQFNSVIGVADDVVDQQTRERVTAMNGYIVVLGVSANNNVEGSGEGLGRIKGINELHREEEAKIDQKVAFFVQDGIDLDHNLISRNVVENENAQHAEVICVYFNSQNSGEFSVFWNNIAPAVNQALIQTPNARLFFVPSHPFVDNGFGDLEDNSVGDYQKRIRDVVIDGQHIAAPIFALNMDDFKDKAKDAAVLGSSFVAAPAMVPVDVPAPQEKKNPHRGSLKDFKHSRFERKAYLNTYFENHGVAKAGVGIELDWMQLQLLSMEPNCETAQHIRNQVGAQIDSLGEEQSVDQNKYKLVLDLLRLLDKEERRLKPKVITFFASANYSEKYIAQREAKRKLILETAKQVFDQLNRLQPGEQALYGNIQIELQNKTGHVPKAMLALIQTETNRIANQVRLPAER